MTVYWLQSNSLTHEAAKDSDEPNHLLEVPETSDFGQGQFEELVLVQLPELIQKLVVSFRNRIEFCSGFHFVHFIIIIIFIVIL